MDTKMMKALARQLGFSNTHQYKDHIRATQGRNRSERKAWRMTQTCQHAVITEAKKLIEQA